MKRFTLNLNVEVRVLKHGNGILLESAFSTQLKSALKLLLQIVLILINKHKKWLKQRVT